MVIDISAILVPALQVSGLVLTGVAGLCVDKARAVLHNRFHMDFTDQQVQRVHEAADTAAGVVNMMLARGAMSVHEVHTDNPDVIALAATALNAVPKASDALGLTVPDVAHMIVGRVGKAMDVSAKVVPATAPTAPVPEPK